MPADRFHFQRDCVDRALMDTELGTDEESQLLVLNVGANDDYGQLKQIDPVRVINCDLVAEDQLLGRPNRCDVLFDAARDRWPFDDRSVALTVFGDILEHLSPDEIRLALSEARRVGWQVCITVPEDHRPEVGDEHADTRPRGAVHRTVVTEDLLRGLLGETGWDVTKWLVVEYDDGTYWGQQTMGHFVEAV